MKSALFLLLLPIFSFAQEQGSPASSPGKLYNYLPIQSIAIGDTILPVQLSNMVDNLSSELELASFKNKPLILDFWATWCSSCLKSFPKLQDFQNRYKDQLAILLVTKEPLEKIGELKKRNKLFASINLPVVYNDTLLNRLFRHNLIPHIAWIDARGIVQAITDETALTEENLAAFIAGKKLALPLKQDIFDFDRKKPLLLGNNGGNLKNLLGRSSFTTYLPGLVTGQGRTEEEDCIRYYFINNSIITLYKRASSIPLNRFTLNIPDPERLLLKENEDYKVQTLFSWECYLPKYADPQLLNEILLRDLNTWSPFRGQIQKRKTTCWVLSIADCSKLQSAIKHTATKNLKSSEFITLENQPLSNLITLLNRPEIGAPVVLDETGYKENISMHLTAPPNDLPAVAKQLKAYGLSLKPAQQTIELFIITEKPLNPNH